MAGSTTRRAVSSSRVAHWSFDLLVWQNNEYKQLGVPRFKYHVLILTARPPQYVVCRVTAIAWVISVTGDGW